MKYIMRYAMFIPAGTTALFFGVATSNSLGILSAGSFVLMLCMTVLLTIMITDGTSKKKNMQLHLQLFIALASALTAINVAADAIRSEMLFKIFLAMMLALCSMTFCFIYRTKRVLNVENKI